MVCIDEQEELAFVGITVKSSQVIDGDRIGYGMGHPVGVCRVCADVVPLGRKSIGLPEPHGITHLFLGGDVEKGHAVSTKCGYCCEGIQGMGSNGC